MGNGLRTGVTSSGETCPICGAFGHITRVLTKKTIRAALSEYFGSEPPDGSVVPDVYEIRRCAECTLEYADPQVAGNAKFYAWIASQAGYYANDRWEWDESIRLIGGAPMECRSVLEVGCGGGAYLLRLREQLSVNGVGLDTEPSAVAACRNRGISAHCCTVEDFIATGGDASFDWVVAYHCLEHVTQPLHLVQSLTKLLAPGGTILISTPYSPASFEGDWFDPLNHPPHHLTRWNLRAYEHLAMKCGLELHARMPCALQVPKRALVAAAYARLGVRRTTKGAMMRLSFTHPITVLREMARQLNRERFEGRAAADVVLVELRRASGLGP